MMGSEMGGIGSDGEEATKKAVGKKAANAAL